MAEHDAKQFRGRGRRTSIALGLFWTIAAVATLRASSQGDESNPRPRAEISVTNLQVLPKDTSPAEMRELMERYTQELGVTCSFCHTQDSRARRLDYTSDENPRKGAARVMIRMVNDINNKYLAQISDPRYAELVTCGNCHQGHSTPPRFDPDGQP